MADVAVEIDGHVKYENSAMTHGEGATKLMMRERQREALLTTHNLEVMRLHYEDIVQPHTLEQIMQAYQIPRRRYARTKHW